jgi:hypothetical protein
VSIVGLLLNARVIWIIHKNGKVDLKEHFYAYMSLNSVFNCLFCVVYALYPINYCQQNEKGYFCSKISTTVAAQVIKIVFQAYIGETLKMCSNISCIFISINRYMLVGKEHNPTLENISKLKFRQVVFLTVVFSLLMNIGHAFQYKINYGWEKLPDSGYLSFDLYPSIVSLNSDFKWYSIAYFVINFAIFLVINTSIELSLFRKLRNEIADKRMRAETEILLSQSNNLSGSEVINKIIRGKEKKIEQDRKKNTRAFVMVITNSAVNCFLRFPEIFVFLSSSDNLMDSLLGHKLRAFNHISYSPLSSFLVSCSYFFYILTFTTNVGIYYLFNPIFKHHFIWWESYVKRK